MSIRTSSSIAWMISVLFMGLQTAIAQQDQLEEYFKLRASEKDFSGTVLVSKKDEVIFHRAFGQSNIELGVDNSIRSVHRIGSLTKPITAMGVLRLIQENPLIGLHDPISKHLTGIPSGWKSVTIHHLLTHTSGIPDHFGDLEAVPVEDTSTEIERVLINEANSQLENPSGEVYEYSNFGYVLLGYLIEKVTGSNYYEYLKANILAPLGIQSTYYDDPRIIIQNRSQGYKYRDGVLVHDALKDPAAYSAGGLLSTTQDLFKWHRALKTDIILDANLRKEMFTSHRSNYGFGWLIEEQQGRRLYSHNGGTHGFASRIVYYPNEDVLIVVLANNEDLVPASMTCDVSGLMLEGLNVRPAVPVSLAQSDLEKFTGEYQSDDGRVREIVFKQGRLYYANGDAQYSLSPISEQEFFFTDHDYLRVSFDQEKMQISSCGTDPDDYSRK